MSIASVGWCLLTADQPLWLAALAVAAIAATAAYRLQQYERLRLGLIKEVT